MEKTCNECPDRDTCTAPCATVNAILWHENRIMEKRGEKTITSFPMNNEVRFSETEDYKIDHITDKVPWSSGDARLRKTAVFIERFFNHTPYKELAERYGVTENCIVCMYRDAVKTLSTVIAAMDARRHGIKAAKGTRGVRFTDDQKYFLLVSVFGFSGHEVARMFKLDHRIVTMKVKRLSDEYADAFKRPRRSAYDNLTKEQIMQRMAY